MTEYVTDLFRSPPRDVGGGVDSDKVRVAIDALVAHVQLHQDDPAELAEAAIAFAERGRNDYASDCWFRLSSIRGLGQDEKAYWGSAVLATGRAREAAHLLLDAHVQDRDNLHNGLVAASALQIIGDVNRAVAVLIAVRKAGRGSAQHAYQLSDALLRIGRVKWAARLARRAIALEPATTDHHNLLGYTLLQDGRMEEALAILNSGEFAANAQTHHYASIIYLKLKRYDEALASANRAVATDENNLALLLNRAGVLSYMHDWSSSVEDYRAALALDPEDVTALGGAFSNLVASGFYKDAIPIGARLLALTPGETKLEETLKIIIERHHDLSLKTGLRSVDGDQEASRFGTPPPVRKSLTPNRNARNQINIILALLSRESRTRFGRSRFGYAWVIFEPLVHIGIMITLITTFGAGRSPPLGDSFAIFYFTGIIPYHLFTHTVGHVMRSVPDNRPLLNIPIVRVMDVYIARGIMELLTEVCVAIIILFFMYLAAIDIVPINALNIVAAILLIWVAAFGIGLISSALTAYFSAWERIWGALASLLYFASGTFYIPRAMPEPVREVLSWNPILQCIEMVRVNYFHEPDPHWLDVNYLVTFAFLSVVAGLIVERFSRGKSMGVE